jgi:predicted MFS family arabinose efflux permease
VLAVLRRRDFGLLWLAGLVSVAGDWVLYAALPFFVYERTGSTIATAGMIAAELTPGVLLGSVAGVFVDRWDRKRLLVAANLLQAAVVALLLLAPHGWLWVVYAVAAVQSSVAAFSVPAESALLPSLVGDADLVAANALNALNNRLARLVGVPVGGTLLGLVGLESVVLVDSATFVLAALIIAPIATPRRRPALAETAHSAWAKFWREWHEGLAIVRHNRIAVIFGVLGLMTFGGTMLDPLQVAWVRDTLGRGPQVLAWLTTAHAAAGIAGTLVVGRFGARVAPRTLVGWSGLAAGAFLAVKFNLPSVPLALALSALGGVTAVISSVGVETLVQRGVPDAQRGRVFGALGASGALLSLAGATTGGALAEVVGTTTMLNVAAALIVLAGLVVLWAFAPRRPAESDLREQAA